MRVVAIFFLLSSLGTAQQPSAGDPMRPGVAEPQSREYEAAIRDYRSAITEQQHGEYEAAIRDYRSALQADPKMVEAQVNLGAALAHVGQYDEAIAMYKAALPGLSFKNPVLLNIGLAYYKKGDFANAREQFAAVHKLQPNDGRVATLLGDTDVRLDRPQDAVALLRPLDAGNATNLDFQYVYGLALIGSGQRDEGVQRVVKVAQATNNAGAFLVAGTTFLQMNDAVHARQNLEAALRLNPKLPNIYTLVGTARDKTGDAKDAEPVFREALKVNPDDFEANLYLGTILYKRRNMDEAKIYLDHALKLKPSDTVARYEAAMYKSTSGDYTEAAKELEQLVKDDPQWLDPHVELASLYYKLHRPEDGARERQIVDRLRAAEQSKGPGK
jgi:Tfp pilus assembly protein PilF